MKYVNTKHYENKIDNLKLKTFDGVDRVRYYEEKLEKTEPNSDQKAYMEGRLESEKAWLQSVMEEKKSLEYSLKIIVRDFEKLIKKLNA